MPKDHFSSNAENYAKFRPDYPPELFQFINSIVAEKKVCWDCGTGNGQLAKELSGSFDHVYATDISAQQITQAPKLPNIHYSVQPAEKTRFPNDFFNLIIVGQAIHWFDFETFYQEINRVGVPGSFLVAVGYGLVRIDPVIDPVIDHFYKEIIGQFWDPERRYIDQHYQTIPFPFEEIETPSIQMIKRWALEEFLGYLNTWSAVKRYKEKTGENPVKWFKRQVRNKWNVGFVREGHFPLLLRVGKIDP